MNQFWRARPNLPAVLAWVLFGTAPLAAQQSVSRAAPSSTQPEATAPAPIQDNSFLIEEAYNQEAGVVQHISTFARESRSHAWAYSFTQEWPVFSQRHQLSFTLPVISNGPGQGSGVGDVALNYRYQLADGKRSGILAAPRLSLVLPSGDERRDRGSGGVGVQINLPLTLEHSDRLVTHWNAGGTLTPSARNAAGDEATTRSYSLGASAILLPSPVFNVMLEAAWARNESVIGPDQRAGEESFFLSPGVRGAINFASGLQIVPGFAVPIGIGPSRGDRMLFLYLSFEHPF